MKLSAKIAAIELEGDDIRVVVVKTGSAKPSIIEAHAARARYASPDDRPAALAEAAREALAKVKSKPAIYVLAVDCWNVVVRALTIPFRGASRVAAAVPFELEPYLAFPIDELIVDYVSVREQDGKTDVLAVGVRQALLEDRLDVPRATGVVIESISLDVAGLTTLWMAGRRSPSGLHAQLHVRKGGSVLAVTYNRALAFFRSLPLTPERMHEDPRGASREVQNSIRSFMAGWKGDHDLAGLTVTGLVLDPAERDAFAEDLTPPIAFENLTDALNGVRHLRDALAEVSQGDTHDAASCWDAVVGVAAAAAGGGVALEFRKGPLVPPGALRGLLVHGAFSVALLVLVLLGYIGYCVVDYRRNVDQVARAGAEIWDFFAKTFPDSASVKQGRLANDEGGLQTIALFEQERNKAAEAGSQISVEMLSRPPLLDILKELSEKLPSDKVLVTEVKVRESHGQSQAVSISGDVNDTQAFNQIFENLKKSTILRINEEPILTSLSGKTKFVIGATLQGT